MENKLSFEIKEFFIDKLVLQPYYGSDFSRVASEAFHLARDKKMKIEFNFNDTKILIDGRGW